MTETIIFFVLPIILGYLLGSIPVGYLLGKAYGIDLTKEGSGSTGTTNVLRLVGKRAAVIALIGDFGKGVLAPILANKVHNYLTLNWTGFNSIGLDCNVFFVSGIVMVLASMACLVGHVRSVWIGFKGGKAVASGVGTLFGINWIVGVITALIWIFTVFISRYSSLGALVAIPLSPITMLGMRYLQDKYLYQLGQPENCYSQDTIVFIFYCLIGAAFIIYKHQANIERLMNGTEPKVGEKKKEEDS